IPRVLPEPAAVELDAATWPLPPVMRWLAEAAHLPAEELARTFNCGLGMVAVVDAERASEVARVLTDRSETVVYAVGRVIARADGPAVVIRNTDAAWQA
ncbi:MAG: AIR synthase-related protein, partial [Rhodospirillales bacterium]